MASHFLRLLLSCDILAVSVMRVMDGTNFHGKYDLIGFIQKKKFFELLFMVICMITFLLAPSHFAKTVPCA